jgi:preprotein translocase SecF subunit
MRFLQHVNIDFLTKRHIFYSISGILILIGLAVFFTKGIPLGIDFRGGTEVLVRFSKPVDVQSVRDALDKGGLTGNEIKTLGSETDILIKSPEASDQNTSSDKIRENLISGFPDNKFEVLRIDKVGPKVGKELRTGAIYATIFSLIAILIYLAFRFEFVYAVGAVLALFHDVIMTLGLVAIFNMLIPALNLEISQVMMAAFLTLIGFSTNDTVVVFDRIRENIKLYKNEDILKVMNKSVNYTLSRTIITNGTVFVTVLILTIFGGEVIRSFAFTFLIGSVIGTYSSIYIASAFVVDIKYFLNKRNKKGLKTAVSRA